MRVTAFSFAATATLLLIGASVAMDTAVFELQIGHTQLVKFDKPLGSVVVGDPRIAVAAPSTNGTVAVTALSIGTTTMFFLGEDGTVQLRAYVQVASGTDVLAGNIYRRREIRVFLPRPGGAQGEEDREHRIRRYICGPGCSFIQTGRGSER